MLKPGDISIHDTLAGIDYKIAQKHFIQYQACAQFIHFFTYHNSLCPLYNYTFLFFVQHFRCESPIDWMCTSHSHYTNINTFQTSFQLLSIDHFNLTTTKGNISTNVENLCCIEQRSKRRQVTFECLYFILFLSLLNTSEIRLGT